MGRWLKEVAELESVPPSDAWSEYRNNIREEMIRHVDWSQFRNWPTVRKTLHCGRIPNTDAEYNCMLGSQWVKDLDVENGTSVHQAYSLWLFQKHTNHKFSNSDTFVEFGGGYGEMARMVWSHVQFPRRYIIYDFPELNILQRFYIDDQIGEFKGFRATSDFTFIDHEPPTIFISICALSEAPVPLRDIVLNRLMPDNLLIRYQPSWDGVNNTKYFLDFANTHFDGVHSSPAPEYTNHHYLVAWSRKNIKRR